MSIPLIIALCGGWYSFGFLVISRTLWEKTKTYTVADLVVSLVMGFLGPIALIIYICESEIGQKRIL